MTKTKTKTKTRIVYSGFFVAVALVVLYCGWVYVTLQNVHDDRSKVMVEREDWYEICVDGESLLYYNKVDSDSAFSFLDTNRHTAVTRTVTEGRWVNRWLVPSCCGRIVTSFDSLSQPALNVRRFVERNISLLEKRIADMDVIAEEMEYFFEVHNVQDAGYELVTDEYEKTLREVLRLEHVLGSLKRCSEADSLVIRRDVLYRTKQDTCLFDGKYLQVKSRTTPKEAKAIFARSFVPKKIITHHPKSSVVEPLNDFALRVTPEKGVQLGEWENGKFKGERLEYNPERIYGIDISRHQHEKGRKRFAINWKNLRITSLGKLSKKNVRGEIDYPVSFCYIKATEGTTIRNRYYPSDYQQARKNGIHVGTYHFFSTKSGGAAQAKWFLKNLKHTAGDFPPVLDIEPSEAQIRKMGGVEKLFREVRIWLNAVEAKTGQRPILYISQSFVNKHLSQAPDLKRNYQVWIARYGEYKPDVHMLFWQLSPDGRVRGISTDVDINVFNGYQEKFDAFVKNNKK